MSTLKINGVVFADGKPLHVNKKQATKVTVNKTKTIWQNSLKLTLTQQKVATNGWNLRSFINAHNPHGITNITVYNSLIQPSMQTGNLTGLNVTFVNNSNGQIQANGPGNWALNLTSKMKLVNNGWIRGGGGNGGVGGRGATGATGKTGAKGANDYYYTTSKAHKYVFSNAHRTCSTQTVYAWALETLPTAGNKKTTRISWGQKGTAYSHSHDVECAVAGSSRAGHVTVYGVYSRGTHRTTQRSGLYWNQSIYSIYKSSKVKHNRTGGAGGAGGKGGTGGTGGSGGIGAHYRSIAATAGGNGHGGSVGHSGAPGHGSSPAGGHSGGRGTTGARGHTGGKGGAGGNWGTTGGHGARGAGNGGWGTPGTAGGHSISGKHHLLSGSKTGHVNGSIA